MNRAQLVFGFLVLCLPIIVAGADLSVAAAIALVVLALLLRWIITLSGIMAPANGPELELSSISASHFVDDEPEQKGVAVRGASRTPC